MLLKKPDSKNWYVRLKYRGRLIERSARTTSKAEARRVEENLRRELDRLRARPAGAKTFNDAAIKWLNERSDKRSLKRDIEIIEWLKDRECVYADETWPGKFGDLLLSDITRGVVDDVREQKAQERDASGKRRSLKTVDRYMALLRSILHRARDDWEWVEKVPKVPMYNIKDDSAPRWFTPEEVMRLLRELPLHTRQAAWFSLETGLRSGPIRKLRWDWVTRDGIRFPAGVMKSKKPLTIPLSMDAWHILAEEWGKHPVYVFTYQGRQIKEKFTTAAWYKATKRAKLPGARFHDFRHTWASWHAQNGTPMEVVQELGGWSTYEAMRIYAQFAPSTLGRWANNASRGGGQGWGVYKGSSLSA